MRNYGWIIMWIAFVASIATKLRLQGVTEFELSPGPPPFTVAAYVPGAKVNVIFIFAFNWTFSTISTSRVFKLMPFRFDWLEIHVLSVYNFPCCIRNLYLLWVLIGSLDCLYNWWLAWLIRAVNWVLKN